MLPLSSSTLFPFTILISIYVGIFAFWYLNLTATQLSNLNINSNIGAMANTPSIQSLSDTVSTAKVLESEAPSHGIRALYNHSSTSNPRNAKWSEFHDLILEEKHLKERGKDYPIIQRFSKVETDDGEISWANHSIEIQSERASKGPIRQGLCRLPDLVPGCRAVHVLPTLQAACPQMGGHLGCFCRGAERRRPAAQG